MRLFSAPSAPPWLPPTLFRRLGPLPRRRLEGFWFVERQSFDVDRVRREGEASVTLEIAGDDPGHHIIVEIDGRIRDVDLRCDDGTRLSDRFSFAIQLGYCCLNPRSFLR